MNELQIPLAEIFTAAGAVVWAGAIAGVVQVLKQAIPFIPEHGRGVLYTVMIISALVVVAAAFDLQPQMSGGFLVGAVLTWAAVVTAASGSYEVASKAGRVMQGTTNTTGPDDTAPTITGPVSG